MEYYDSKNIIKKINLQGTYNTRDLGGFEISKNKFTKYNVFFRSDNTHKLSVNDIKKMKENHNLKTVIDLRFDFETKNQVDVFSLEKDIKYHNIPFSIKKDVIEKMFDGTVKLNEVYFNMLKEKTSVKKIFEVFIKNKEGSILFHCVNGKDRTGIISALILGSVGVCKEDILNDYAATYEFIKNNPEVKQGMKKYGEDLFKSSIDNMNFIIETIKNEYGSFYNYLISCSITKEDLYKLQSRFICS